MPANHNIKDSMLQFPQLSKNVAHNNEDMTEDGIPVDHLSSAVDPATYNDADLFPGYDFLEDSQTLYQASVISTIQFEHALKDIRYRQPELKNAINASLTESSDNPTQTHVNSVNEKTERNNDIGSHAISDNPSYINEKNNPEESFVSTLDCETLDIGKIGTLKFDEKWKRGSVQILSKKNMKVERTNAWTKGTLSEATTEVMKKSNEDYMFEDKRKERFKRAIEKMRYERSRKQEEIKEWNEKCTVNMNRLNDAVIGIRQDIILASGSKRVEQPTLPGKMQRVLFDKQRRLEQAKKEFKKSLMMEEVRRKEIAIKLATEIEKRKKKSNSNPSRNDKVFLRNTDGGKANTFPDGAIARTEEHTDISTAGRNDLQPPISVEKIMSEPSQSKHSMRLPSPKVPLSSTLPSLSTLSALPFTPSPSKIMFRDVVPGKTYKEKIILTNTTGRVNSLKLLPLDETLDQSIALTFIPPGHMSPGLTCSLYVIYTAPEDVTEKTDGKLWFEAAVGGTFAIEVEILVRKCSPTIKVGRSVRLVDDTFRIDCGQCTAGTTTSKSFELCNEGVLGTDYWISSDPEDAAKTSPFSIIRNQAGRLDGYGAKVVTVSFSPPPEIDSSVVVRNDFHVKFSSPKITPLRFSCTATALETLVYLSHDTLDFQTCIVGCTYRERLMLNNRGNIALRFTVTVAEEDIKSLHPAAAAETMSKTTFENISTDVSARTRLSIKMGNLLCSPNTGFVQPGEPFPVSLVLQPTKDGYHYYSREHSLNSNDPPTFRIKLQITVHDRNSPKQHISCYLSGRITLATISFSPKGNVDFGHVAVSRHSIQRLSITNHCHVPQTLSFSSKIFNQLKPLGLSAQSSLTVKTPTDNDQLELSPRQTVHTYLIFHSEVPGLYSMKLLATNDLGKSFELECSGVVYRPPLRLSPRAIEFPAISRGSSCIKSINLLWDLEEKETRKRAKLNLSNPSEIEELAFQFEHPQVIVPMDAWQAFSNDPDKDEKITLIDNTPIQIINGIDHVTINVPREDIPVAVFPHEGTVQWGAEYSVNVAFAPRKVEECDGKLQVGAAVIDQRVDGTGQDSTTATIKTTKGNENPPTSPTAKSAGKKVRNGTASAGTKPQPTLSTSVKKQPKKIDVLQANTHIMYRIPCRVSVRVRDFVKKKIKPAVSTDKYYPKESLIYLEVSGMVGKPSFELIHLREKLEFDVTPLNHQVVKPLGIKNLTSDAIDIKLSKPNPPFSIINPIETIPAEDIVNFSVAYEPKTEGTVEDYLEITTMTTQTRLNLTGISYKPSVLFEPLTLESYDFGDILVNDIGKMTFKIHCTATYNVNYQIQLSDFGDKMLPFEVTPSEGSIPPGVRQEIVCEFKPQYECDNFWVVGKLKIWGLDDRTIKLWGRCWKYTSFLSGFDYEFRAIENISKAGQAPEMESKFDAKIKAVENPDEPSPVEISGTESSLSMSKEATISKVSDSNIAIAKTITLTCYWIPISPSVPHHNGSENGMPSFQLTNDDGHDPSNSFVPHMKYKLLLKDLTVSNVKPVNTKLEFKKPPVAEYTIEPIQRPSNLDDQSSRSHDINGHMYADGTAGLNPRFECEVSKGIVEFGATKSIKFAMKGLETFLASSPSRSPSPGISHSTATDSTIRPSSRASSASSQHKKLQSASTAQSPTGSTSTLKPNTNKQSSVVAQRKKNIPDKQSPIDDSSSERSELYAFPHACVENLNDKGKDEPRECENMKLKSPVWPPVIESWFRITISGGVDLETKKVADNNREWMLRVVTKVAESEEFL